jgi:hypothetical protein
VHANEIQPRDDGAGAFLVDREAELVKRAREVDPGLVVGLEATGKDDGSESAQSQLFGAFAPKRLRSRDIGWR